jgi:2,4-didehydro-3-deoxy-L-rhamnonate hydrolase
MHEIPTDRTPNPRRGWLLAIACAAFSLGCGFEWEPLFHEQMAPGKLDNVEIRTTEEALTFFRVVGAGEPRVFAATKFEDGVVSGVDLSRALGEAVRDPIDAFNQLGYSELARVVAEASEVSSFPASELTIPADLGDHHIAAGTNFPEHAEEAGVEDGPYLFPKLVAPTAHDASVSAGQALLDYEVEVGWVPLVPLSEGESPEFVGLIACNDYTDRDVLLRHVDTGNVASGQGFTTSKSFPGFLPVGNLFVIPRDYRKFQAELRLELYVNGWLRQREWLRRGVWQLDQLIRETWRRKDRTWAHRGQQVSLFSGSTDTIAARVLLMSGTPPGVVFNELNVEQKASGFFDFVLFGWGDSIPDHAIDNYIRDARGAGIYLHPGDRVAIHIDGLGVVHNQVIE